MSLKDKVIDKILDILNEDDLSANDVFMILEAIRMQTMKNIVSDQVMMNLNIYNQALKDKGE